MVVVGGLVLLVAAVALLVLLVVRDDDERPVRVDLGRVGNATIHIGDRDARWSGETAPRLTGAPRYPIWKAFDQRTESFLYVSKFGRVFVAGEDRSASGFVCDHAWPACELITFGPGPDEVTVPVDDPGGLNFLQSVQVMTLDGRVRDTLDLSAAVTNSATGQPLLVADLAWSPDGSRLAVSIEPQFDCDPRRFPCESKVWIFHRDGGQPQLVYTERASDELVAAQHPNLPVLRGLAWSPRGHSLALVATGSLLGHAADKGIWPRLIALRFLLGRRVRTDTLHVYDDRHHQVGPDEYDLELFAFAWSPDGSRIAVPTDGGIAEISAGDGQLLARHAGEQVHGPLAWLRER